MTIPLLDQDPAEALDATRAADALDAGTALAAQLPDVTAVLRGHAERFAADVLRAIEAAVEEPGTAPALGEHLEGLVRAFVDRATGVDTPEDGL
jgi:hypothetical protein